MMRLSHLGDTKRAVAFSVQYYPEASPGPMDSHYLFEKFAGMMGGVID
jgi:carbamoylphosphate synthase small subunit